MKNKFLLLSLNLIVLTGLVAATFVNAYTGGPKNGGSGGRSSAPGYHGYEQLCKEGYHLTRHGDVDTSSDPRGIVEVFCIPNGSGNGNSE